MMNNIIMLPCPSCKRDDATHVFSEDGEKATCYNCGKEHKTGDMQYSNTRLIGIFAVKLANLQEQVL